MKRDTINYFSVGLFVLGMFALLLATLFAVTGKGGDTVSYFVRYNNIAGITKGSTVTVNGYKVGRVIDVTPFIDKDESGYELELAVRQDWSIPADSVARIIMPGLLSEKQVDITPGKSEKFLAANDHLIGKKEVDVMVAMQNVAAEISELADNSIKPLATKLGTTLDNIDGNLDGQLPRITAKLNTLLTSLNTSAASFNAILNETNKTHIDHFFTNADNASAEVATLGRDIHLLKNEIHNFLKDTQQLINENRGNIHKGVAELADSSEQLNNHLNPILYHLEQTSQNLHELTRALRDNPALLIRGTRTVGPEEEQ